MKYKKSSRGCCTIHESAKQDITPQIYTHIGGMSRGRSRDDE